MKPAPTFPSAKYQVLLTGPVPVVDGVPVGDGEGLGDDVADGLGDGEGDGVFVGDGVTVGVFVTDAVGDAVFVADALGVGVREPLDIEKLSVKALVTETYCIPNVVAETVN